MRFPQSPFGIAELILLIPAVLSADVRYSLSNLGTLGGTESQAWGLNNEGQVVGDSMPFGGGIHAFLYSNSSMHELGPLALDSHAYGINDKGDIVGTANFVAGSTISHAFLYSGGRMQDLGSAAGATGASRAEKINNSGLIVGSSTFDPSDNNSYRPVTFKQGTISDLGNFGSPGFGSASAINDRGEITGSLSVGIGPQHAFLYSAGHLLDLGVPGGVQSAATGVNNDGEVVGFIQITQRPYPAHAFIYEGGLMTDLTPQIGGNAAPVSVNDAGQIVGTLELAPGRSSAFIYENGVATDLNTVIPPDSGWQLINATAINDAGQIAGNGMYAGHYRAFLLTPVPEPIMTTALLIAALALCPRIRS